MSTSAPTSPPVVHRSRPGAATLLLAVAGAGAAVGLWIVLASITGLIFHFLPGAPFLAAAWVFGQVERGRRAAWPELAVMVAASASAAAIGVLVVASIGRELDPPAITGLVALAGAAIGVVWLRRGPSVVAADHRSDVPNL